MAQQREDTHLNVAAQQPGVVDTPEAIIDQYLSLIIEFGRSHARVAAFVRQHRDGSEFAAFLGDSEMGPLPSAEAEAPGEWAPLVDQYLDLVEKHGPVHPQIQAFLDEHGAVEELKS